MFQIIRPAQCQSYNIILEDIIKPYWDLINEIFAFPGVKILLSIDFSKIDLAFDQQLKDIDWEKINSDLYNELLGQALSVILNSFVKEILSPCPKDYKDKSLLLIYKKGKYIIACNEVDIKTHLRQWFINYKVLDSLISLVCPEPNNLLDKLREFDTRDLYAHFAEEPELNYQIDYPFFLFEYLDSSKYVKEDIEPDDIWINESVLKNKFSLQLKDIPSYHLIKDKQNLEKILGIGVGDFCFVINNDLSHYLLPEYLPPHFWNLLQFDVLRIKEKSGKKYSSDLIRKFLESAKDEYFTNTLSYLVNNLYLKKDIKIEAKYTNFFEQLIPLKDLDYLNDFEFFLSDGQERKPVLGIYNHGKKVTDSHYNLVHMVADWGENLAFYNKVEPVEKKKDFVHVLIPELAYFYLSDFFEYYFDEILKSLEVEHLWSYKLQTSDGNKHEVDFIIKQGKEFYFVETKTKLTTMYINNYIRKCELWATSLKELGKHIHFMIVGCFSDEDCGIFKYMKKGEMEGYNSRREGLHCIPYYFKIPLTTAGQELICVSESSFERLKKLMSSILLS